MAPGRYPYQFAGNYAKIPGQLAVDTHCLIALMAPRPVLLQTGNTDYRRGKGGLLSFMVKRGGAPCSGDAAKFAKANNIKASYEKFYALNPYEVPHHHNYAWFAYKAEQWAELNRQLPLLGKVNYEYFGGKAEFDKMVKLAREHAGK